MLKQPVAPPQVADTAVKTVINLLQGDTTTRNSTEPVEPSPKSRPYANVSVPMEATGNNSKAEHEIQGKPSTPKPQSQPETILMKPVFITTTAPKKAPLEDRGRKNHILYHALTVRTMRNNSAPKLLPWPKIIAGKDMKLPQSRAIIGGIKATVTDMKSFISSKI